MAQQPNNVPTSIAIPSGAPSDLLSIASYLTQLGSALNNWIAQVANVINAQLAGTLILQHLPKADPHIIGQVWNNSGTLQVSAG